MLKVLYLSPQSEAIICSKRKLWGTWVVQQHSSGPESRFYLNLLLIPAICLIPMSLNFTICQMGIIIYIPNHYWVYRVAESTLYIHSESSQSS
jgi:hypothetical protein